MTFKRLLAIPFMLIGILGAGAAAAGGSHVHFGVAIGAPPFWPGYYSYPWPYAPAPYYPQVVTAPAQPIYIERAQAAPSAPNEYWWYYCAEARTYYPYVSECPGGWQRVSPRPPS